MSPSIEIFDATTKFEEKLVKASNAFIYACQRHVVDIPHEEITLENGYQFIYAVSEGEIVGLALNCPPGAQMPLLAFYTAPGWRRSGVGSQLVAFMFGMTYPK